ncbi:MAG: hypothetical protein OXU20_09155 [Myxococcales bacterium]|nr:hypothetical protein [Myxococcales bacterium]
MSAPTTQAAGGHGVPARASVGKRLPLTTVAIAVLLGALLRYDALSSGFWADDYLFHAMLAGEYPSQRPAWDLFRFSDGTAEDMRRLTDYGYFPWWSHPTLNLSMLRPLASLLHALDYHLLGFDAFLHHVHSLLWWAALVGAVALVLFEVLPRQVAAIALCLFALDESHAIPLVWLSNRSVLLASTFSFLGLWAHVRHRRGRGGGWGKTLSVGSYGLAFACGEYAFANVGYLVAFELLGADSPFLKRLRSAAPVLALACAYLACRVSLGHGVAHSGLYTSPMGEPLAYLGKLLWGVPVLAGDILLTIPADYWSFGSPQGEWLRLLGPWAADWKVVHVALGGASMVVVLGLCVRLRSLLEARHARSLYWLLLGAFLGLLPLLGSFVTTRLVVPASVAGAALVGTLVHQCLLQLRKAFAPRRPAALVAALVGLCVLGFLHGLRAPYVSLSNVRFFAFAALSRTAFPLHAALDQGRLAEQRVVLFAAADVNDAPFFPFVLRSHGRPMPAAFRLISPASSALDVYVVDTHTLELTVLDLGALAGTAAGSLARSANAPIARGQVFVVSGMWVTVMDVAEGQPRRLRVRFDVPLSDPSLVFLQAGEHGLAAVHLPPAGSRLHLPAPQMPDLNRIAGSEPD